jgi:cellobiose phosphorylase
LLVDPSIPSAWPGFKVTRKFRNATYQIEVKNPTHINKGIASVNVDDREQESNLIPVFDDGKVHSIEIILG